jgi:hypothetical protein
VPFDRDRRGERRQQPFGQLGQFPSSGRRGDQDDELVPADPGDQVARVELLGGPRGDGDEQLVTDRVPEAVVDYLEAVQIEEAQRDLDGRLPGAQRRCQPIQEHRPVRQAGQRIVGGLVREPILQPALLRDVLDDRHLILRAPVVTADQRDGEVSPHRDAILAEEQLLGAERVPPALDEVPVVGPHRGGVVRMHEVGNVTAAEFGHVVSQQLHQRRLTSRMLP